MSQCLAERAIDHVVLERGEIANSWRSERWDSLRLLTPNWQSRLPGFGYEGDDPDGYRTMPEVIAFIDRYAEVISAPVETHTKATAVAETEDGFRVETDRGDWRCRTVVLASGACNIPSVPKLAAAIPPEIATLTSKDYRNPDQLPDGGVLTIASRNVTLDNGYTDRHVAVDPGDYVLIAVEDTGTGMSPEVAERAIQPFFTTKEVGEGSGLGLSMVYGFARQSGGHLEIVSTLGRGTAVRLYLPRATKAVAEIETEAPSISEANGHGERILLVEDQPDVRKLARRLLTRLGYVVFEAHDGTAALSLLDDLVDVDLLFTDIMLPGGMDGEQLAREARARCPNLKVLYSSGYAQNAARSANGAGDAILLVNKPFVMQDLAGAVRRTLQAGEA